jgi:hypothetical protein
VRQQAEGFRKAFFPLPKGSKASKFIYEKQKKAWSIYMKIAVIPI